MKKGALWPLSLVLFFGGLIALYAYLFHVADDPRALVVEPNYYQKGLHYDDEMAQQRENTALGWRIAPTVTPAGGGNAELSVALTDASGRRLDGATVSVVAMHNLLADHPDSATLADRGGGVYAAMLAMPRAGMWELKFDVTRAGARFTEDERIELEPAPAAR